MTATIREARRQDLPAILRMMDSLNAYSGLPTGRLDAASLAAALFGRARFLFGDVAFLGRDAVGYALSHDAFTSDTAERALYRVDLFVEPAARGSGAGIALMGAVAARAQARGATHLLWLSMNHNWRTRRFYARLGASDDKVHHHMLEGAPFRRLAARGAKAAKG